MGDTGTDHRKPANIEKLKGDSLPAYITTDGNEVIVLNDDGWTLYRRVAVFGTRREAAQLAAEPTRRVTLA